MPTKSRRERFRSLGAGKGEPPEEDTVRTELSPWALRKSYVVGLSEPLWGRRLVHLRVASAASFMFHVFLLIDCWFFDFRQVTWIPELQLVSRVLALKYTIDTLPCSPQKKWVFLNKKHPHISPKVGPRSCNFNFWAGESRTVQPSGRTRQTAPLSWTLLSSVRSDALGSSTAQSLWQMSISVLETRLSQRQVEQGSLEAFILQQSSRSVLLSSPGIHF